MDRSRVARPPKVRSCNTQHPTPNTLTSASYDNLASANRGCRPNLLITFLFLTSIVPAVWSATYRVDNIQQTSHANKIYASFKDLRELATLTGGDIVDVAANTTPYYEDAHFCKGDPSFTNTVGNNDSGSPGAWLTIRSVLGNAGPGARATIDGSVNGSLSNPPSNLHTATVGLVEFNNVEYVKFQGFLVRNSKHTGICVRNTDGAAPRTNNVIVQNCVVSDCRADGIIVVGLRHQGSTLPPGRPYSIQIANNIVSFVNEAVLEVPSGYTAANLPGDIPKPGGQALTVENAENVYVYDNTVQYFYKEGIDVINGSQQVKVYRNVIGNRQVTMYYNHNFGPAIYIDGASRGLSDIEVYRNVAYDQCIGIYVGSESGGNVNDVSIHNNLIYRSSNFCFAISGNGGEGVSGNQTNVKVISNTFEGNNGLLRVAWILETQQSKIAGFEFKNNIVSRATNGSAALFYAPSSINLAQLAIDTNLFYDGGGPHDTVGTNVKTGNPIFQYKSYSTYGYVPTGTPARDVGITIQVPEIAPDRTGYSRTGSWDIGAIEFR